MVLFSRNLSSRVFEIKVVDDETNGLTGHDLGLYEGNEFHVYEF